MSDPGDGEEGREGGEGEEEKQDDEALCVVLKHYASQTERRALVQLSPYLELSFQGMSSHERMATIYKDVMAGLPTFISYEQHIAECKDQLCQVPHCVSSRYVLSHYHRCKDPRCAVCGPVREAIQRRTERGLRQLGRRAAQMPPQPVHACAVLTFVSLPCGTPGATATR